MAVHNNRAMGCVDAVCRSRTDTERSDASGVSMQSTSDDKAGE